VHYYRGIAQIYTYIMVATGSIVPGHLVLSQTPSETGLDGVRGP
jgi:hypothetical protein